MDVRAVLFRGTDEILMVQEKIDGDRWTEIMTIAREAGERRSSGGIVRSASRIIRMSFSAAEENFHTCARHGLDALDIRHREQESERY